MNPISRLRMRARSGASRLCDRLAVQHVACPRSACRAGRGSRAAWTCRSPTGPAMATYSPRSMSRWMPDERVGLDLVGVEDLRQVLEADQDVVAGRSSSSSPLIVYLSADRGRARPTADMSERMTWSPSAEARRRSRSCSPRCGPASPARARPRRRPGSRRNRPTVALGLAAARAGRRRARRQALELDGAVDGEVGPRALGQRALERDVDGHRAVLGGGIDARPRVPGTIPLRVSMAAAWPSCDVLGLRLRRCGSPP